jgi:ATP-dependent Clp protease ATP-binding subunit ClpC
LDEGHLTDSTGRPINFRQTIIIMTTNVGADHFHRNKRIGFDQDKDLSAVNDRVHEELKKSFKQELLNRLDKVLYFQPLSDNALLSIIDQEIKEKQKQLDANGFNLNIDAQWPQKMLARYTQKEHGARGLRRIVEDEILKIITP